MFGLPLFALLLAISGCNATGLQPTTPAQTERPPAGQARATPTRTLRPTQVAGQTPAPSPTPTSAIPVQAGELKGVQVAFWHSFDGAAGAALENMVAAFNRDNDWGINVRLTVFEDNLALDEAIRQAGSSGGALPQILSAYPAQLARWELELVNLRPYLDDPGWGLSAAEQTDFLPAAWPPAPESGDERMLTGLPWYRHTRLLLYHRTQAEALGFKSPPETPEAFASQACAAARALRNDSNPANDGRGGWLAQPVPGGLGPWIWAFGGEFFRQDDYHYTSQAALQASESLIDWSRQGCAWGDSQSEALPALLAGEALFYLADSSEALALTQALQSSEGAGDWQALALPTVAGVAPSLPLSGPELVLLPNPARPQLAAWLFVRWLSASEQQAQWAKASGHYPSRFSAADLLQADAGLPAAWRGGLALLKYGRSEPSTPSWTQVRWAEAEALERLMSPGGPAATTTLKTLETLAQELQRRP